MKKTGSHQKRSATTKDIKKEPQWVGLEGQSCGIVKTHKWENNYNCRVLPKEWGIWAPTSGSPSWGGGSCPRRMCPRIFGFDGQQGLLLEKAMAPHSSTLAWKIPWMEEPGRLQSMGLLRVRPKLIWRVSWRCRKQLEFTLGDTDASSSPSGELILLCGTWCWQVPFWNPLSLLASGPSSILACRHQSWDAWGQATKWVRT